MRKYLAFTFLFSLSIQQVVCQNMFVPLDEDFNTWIDKSATNEKDLYVFSPRSSIGYRNAEFRISKWNGLFWTQLPAITATNVFYGNSNNLTIDFHNNQLVIAGSFFSNGEKIKGICTWNGTDWLPLGGGIHSSRLIHDEFSINDMASFKGELFVCGDFNIADDLPVKNLIKFNNGNWEDIDSKEGEFHTLTIVEDTLYVTGNFSSIESTLCNNIAAYYNNSWHNVPNSFPSRILKTVSYKNNLVVATKDGFFWKNDAGFDPINNNLKIESIDDLLSHNGMLYASGLFITPTNDSLRLIAVSDVSFSVYLKDSEVYSPISNKILLNQINNEIYLTGSFQRLKGKPFKHSAKFKPGFSILTGQVYIDNNTNCVYDDGDVLKTNTVVSLNDGEYYTSTDASGTYSMFVKNNQTSTIEIFPADNEVPICNGSERTVRTSGSDSVLVEHFALKLDKQETPIKVAVTSPSGYQVKHGYSNKYYLSCFTADSSKYPISVTLQVDERLSEFESTVKPVRRTKDIVVWEFTKNEVIEFSYRITPSDIFMHDQLQFNAEAHSKKEDQYERHSLQQKVVSAYDPNDKQCNKYTLSTTEKQLEYLVRFQNLGNDNARNIHIVDTIDQTLPIEFIQILKNSHYKRYSTDYRVRDHAIIWSFKGIELPPKVTAGDTLSSGFVAYQCNLDKHLSIGQEITNTAYIYFDYQPPVITNTTKSVVVKEGNPIADQIDEVVLYPNPTNGRINIQAKTYQILKCHVYSGEGKKVFSNVYSSPSLKADIDLSHLPVGIYYVNVIHRFGSETHPLLVH